MYYYLTLRIKREDGFIATYETKAWLRVGTLSTKIHSFDKVLGSETKSKSLEAEKTVSTKKMGKKGLDVFKGISLPRPMTNSEFNSGIVSGKLRARALCILVSKSGAKGAGIIRGRTSVLLLYEKSFQNLRRCYS